MAALFRFAVRGRVDRWKNELFQVIERLELEKWKGPFLGLFYLRARGDLVASKD